MVKKIYFITGGARSGKSSYAEQLANSLGGRHAYVATAQALDAEMAERIENHKKDRGDSWETFEEPLDVAELIAKVQGDYQVMLFDCLTLWLSNVLARTDEDANVMKRIHELVDRVRSAEMTSIIVSNEVGLGIVPDNPLARRFRDVAGILNQRMAQAADEVYFMAAGIPVRIK